MKCELTSSLVHPFKIPSSIALILLPDRSSRRRLLSAWNSMVEKIGFNESPNKLSVNRSSINVSCGINVTDIKFYYALNERKLIFPLDQSRSSLIYALETCFRVISLMIQRDTALWAQHSRRRLLTCIPLNALSDNLRIALCEKSSFFIGKFDVAKVYLWSSIVHFKAMRSIWKEKLEKEKKFVIKH
jgi:hypothetical protein